MIQKSQVWVYPRQLKAESQSDICTPMFYCSIIQSSQEVEVIQMSMKEWMDKENVAYTYNGILFTLKKEGNPVTCFNMDEP